MPTSPRSADQYYSLRPYMQILRHRYGFNIIFPMWLPDSIKACACVAASNGNVAWTTGLILPDSMSGQTLLRKALAIAALNSVGRERSVNARKLARLKRNWARSMVVFAP